MPHGSLLAWRPQCGAAFHILLSSPGIKSGTRRALRASMCATKEIVVFIELRTHQSALAMGFDGVHPPPCTARRRFPPDACPFSALAAFPALRSQRPLPRLQESRGGIDSASPNLILRAGCATATTPRHRRRMRRGIMRVQGLYEYVAMVHVA